MTAKKCKRHKLLSKKELNSLVRRRFLEEQWSLGQIANHLVQENSIFKISLFYHLLGDLRWNVWHHRATALWREPWYNQKVAPSREDQTVRRTAEVRGKIVISNRIQKRPQEADDRKGYQEDLCVSYRWEDRTAIRAAEGKTQNHHAPVTQALNGLPFYFPDPHAPWQRGINENTNGLLRKYLPKSFDIALLSGRDITGFINNQLQTLQMLGLESTLWSLFYQTLHLTWQFKRILCNAKKRSSHLKLLLLVRLTGLEPVPIAGHAPQTCAYANSATTAD